jgi:VCBS repeat-containing protein
LYFQRLQRKKTVTATFDLNQAPTDIALSTSSVDENSSVGTVVGILSTTDPNATDTHTYSIQTVGVPFQIGGAGDDELQVSGVLDYETQNSYSITIRTTDFGGLMYDEIFTITINPVNDNAPVAVDDTGTVDEGATLNVAAPGVLSNDTDADLPGDTLTVNAVNGLPANVGVATATATGTVTVNADGSYSYVHDGSETFTDSFTYTLSDGVNTSNVATVTITINPVNDNAPVAVNDTGATDENTVLNVAAPGVLANDSDMDTGDTFTVTAYDAVSTNGAGVTVNADGSYTYDPTGSATLQALAAGDSLDDTFTYTIADSQLTTAMATVTITVSGVNDAPVAVDDAATTDEDTLLNIAAPGVLANDSDADTTDTFSVTSYDAASAKGAIVTVNADGSGTYDPTGSAVLQALALGDSTRCQRRPGGG